MMPIRLGCLAALERLNHKIVWTGGIIAWLFALLVALLERLRSAEHAADHTLTGAVFGLVVPLLCYGLVARAHGAEPSKALAGIARFGMDRRRAQAGALLTTWAIAAAIGGFIAVMCVAFARPWNDPLWLADILATAWISLVATAAYVMLFAIGTKLGKQGGGRLWLLAIDWLFGASSGGLAMLVPRGHTRALLGGEPVLGLSGASALGALAALAAAYFLLALWRTPR